LNASALDLSSEALALRGSASPAGVLSCAHCGDSIAVYWLDETGRPVILEYGGLDVYVGRVLCDRCYRWTMFGRGN